MTLTTRTLNSTLPAAMKLKDAAELLTVHPETLRRMAVKNEIPSVRIRARWAIPSQYIEDWINGHLDAWTQSEGGVWQRNLSIDMQISGGDTEFRKCHGDPPSGGGLVKEPQVTE